VQAMARTCQGKCDRAAASKDKARETKGLTRLVRRKQKKTRLFSRYYDLRLTRKQNYYTTHFNGNEAEIGNGILMKDQIKGAAKLFFIFNLMIAALNIWIMKDNRHFDFVITNDQCQTEVMEKQALAVYGEMN
jgi:hypothetical protein